MANQKMQELLKGKKKNFDINFYQSYISDLYSEINQKRQFIDIYGYLHRNVGYLGKSISKDGNDFSKFILPISWLFSLSTNLNIKLQDAFIRQYPGICPYCLERHCVCFKTGKTPLRSIPAYEMQEEMYFKREEFQNSRELFNFDKAVNLINDIFSVNEVIWKIAGEYHHMFKIHQEVAEVHEAYGNFKKAEEEKLSDTNKLLDVVNDEIADVFAWILGAWSIKYPGKSLDSAFIDYYLYDCPVCGAMPCKCGLRDMRPSTLIDFDQLKIVREKLIKLNETLPNHQEEISELIKSYENALNTRKTTTATVALSQSQEKLEELERKISTIGGNSHSSLSISEIIEIINTTLKFGGPSRFPPVSYIHVENMSHSRIQQSTSDSNQVFNFSSENKKEIVELISEIKQHIDELNLSLQDKSEAKADVETIETQIASPKPKSAIIRESLLSLKTIFEGIAGNVVADLLLKKMTGLL